MNIIHLFFGGYRLVHKNDLNSLYAKTHAAHTRLKGIQVSTTSMRDGVEKNQVLEILKEAREIMNRLTSRKAAHGGG